MEGIRVEREGQMNRRSAMLAGIAAAFGVPAATTAATPVRTAARTTVAPELPSDPPRRVYAPCNIHEERIVILFSALERELSAIVQECLEEGISGDDDNYELYDDARATHWLIGMLSSPFDNRTTSLYGVKSPKEIQVMEDRLDLRNLVGRFFEVKQAELEDAIRRMGLDDDEDDDE